MQQTGIRTQGAYENRDVFTSLDIVGMLKNVEGLAE